eukprot:gene13480-biopygen9095
MVHFELNSPFEGHTGPDLGSDTKAPPPSACPPHTCDTTPLLGCDNWTPLPLSPRYLSPVISRYRYRPLPLSLLPLSPILWPAARLAAWRWLVGLASRWLAAWLTACLTGLLAGCWLRDPLPGWPAAHNSSVSSVQFIMARSAAHNSSVSQFSSVSYGPLGCSQQCSQFRTAGRLGGRPAGWAAAAGPVILLLA